MSQKALVLHPDARRVTEVEVTIPQPSGQPGDIHPSNYRDLLPNADPNHLMVADCPFSHLAGHPVAVVYDASHQGRPNPMASRLTTNVETGLEVEIQGDAVALFTSPGEDLGLAQWQELDNVIYDELLEFFGQGLRPKPADLDRLVADFKAGRFRYGQHDAANDEDENKDDGSLPGWG